MREQIVIVTNPDMEARARFGPKEVFTLPEPEPICLLGMGAFAVIRKKGTAPRKDT